jgi:type I restriction enzyme S subunit
MKSEWPVVEVKDACNLVVDCINNTAPTVEHETPYKMIRTPNIEDGHLYKDDVKYVEEEVYKKWTRRAKVNSGDVLLTREAPLGDVGLVREDDTIFLGQRIMQYRPDPDILDSRYLTYAFLSPFVQSQIHKYKGSGSVVDHIRVPECESLEIPLPPLKYQKKIAKLLNTFDRKIRLNTEMSKTWNN